MISKKQLKKIIKEQDEIIKKQAIFLPAFEKLKTALETYEKTLYTACENECNYIHAALKTAIGVLMPARTQIISNIKTEMEKITEFYITNILQEKPQ